VSVARSRTDRIGNEARTLRLRYLRRSEERDRNRYAPLAPSVVLETQHRERVMLALLRRAGLTSVTGQRLLDVGCGGGTELVRWVARGLKPTDAFGVDLLSSRLSPARELHPSIHLVQGNGAELPFRNATFDIVTQFVVFSSILDPGVRRQAAAEIERVLRPSGHLIWYDFWLNPTNRDTRGVRVDEIRRLFPNCRGQFRSLTLAPPLSRLIAPRSWLLASILKELRPFQTHYLGVLTKSG